MAQIKIKSGFSSFFHQSSPVVQKGQTKNHVHTNHTTRTHLGEENSGSRWTAESMERYYRLTWLQMISVPSSKQHTIWLLIQALHTNVYTHFFEWQEESRPVTLALTPDQVYFKDFLYRGKGEEQGETFSKLSELGLEHWPNTTVSCPTRSSLHHQTFSCTGPTKL